MMCIFFFFQAEDGIRDWSVTGVQTCALPISSATAAQAPAEWRAGAAVAEVPREDPARRREGRDLSREARTRQREGRRSEERRVGKECRTRWAAEHKKKEGEHGERCGETRRER